MAKLDKEHQVFIVTRLAVHDSISEIVQAFAEEFPGVRVTPQQVDGYDPTKPYNAGRRIAKWQRQLFEETRAAFHGEKAQLAIKHKDWRLSRLERMVRRAEQRGNFPLAASLLEQAAKECGDVFTNRRKMDHSGSLSIEGAILAAAQQDGAGAARDHDDEDEDGDGAGA